VRRIGFPFATMAKAFVKIADTRREAAARGPRKWADIDHARQRTKGTPIDACMKVDNKAPLREMRRTWPRMSHPSFCQAPWPGGPTIAVLISQLSEVSSSLQIGRLGEPADAVLATIYFPCIFDATYSHRCIAGKAHRGKLDENRRFPLFCPRSIRRNLAVAGPRRKAEALPKRRRGPVAPSIAVWPITV